MFVQEHGSQWGPIDSVNVDHCSFNGNTACYGGGFYVGGYSVPFLTNCKFGNNQASVVGGAIYYHYSGITVINSAFWSNSALRGGGLWGKGVFHQSISEPGVIIHRAKVINSTFYSNSATNGNGGAIYFDYWNTDGYDGQPSPAPLIANCILWNDSSTNIYSKEIGLGCSSKPEVRHCFIERLATGFPTHKSKIGINPNFVNSSDSQNNGLQLQLTSQCIDWGENSTLPSGINTDIIGNNRKVDISNVPDVDEGTTPIVDIGAYEYQN